MLAAGCLSRQITNFPNFLQKKNAPREVSFHTEAAAQGS